MTISERITELYFFEKKRGRSLSKEAGIIRSTVSGYTTDKEAKPSFKNVCKILAAYPNLNARWLILGEGEMWANENELNETSVDYGKDVNMIAWVRELEARIKTLENK